MSTTTTTKRLIQQHFITLNKISALENRIISLANRLSKLCDKLDKMSDEEEDEAQDLRKTLLLTKMKVPIIGEIQELEEQVDEEQYELVRLAKEISKEGGFAADWEDDDDVWC